MTAGSLPGVLQRTFSCPSDRNQGQPRTLRAPVQPVREFAGSRVDASTSPDIVADLILSALPRLPAVDDDPLYVEWYANLMRLVEEHHSLPIAYADYFDEKPGWEIGWDSGIRHPHPPASPTGLLGLTDTTDASTR
jgi:hypothetical protein